MADYAPVFMGGQPYTLPVGASAVTGGQLVEISATGVVGPAGAASVKVVGVAAFDAITGALVTIHRQGIQSIVAPAGVTAGATLKAAAAGTVATWVSGTDAADLAIGRAVTTAGTGVAAQVLLFI
jgi:hypothetical protein